MGSPASRIAPSRAGSSPATVLSRVRFARAVRTDEDHELAGRDREAHPFQHLVVGAVAGDYVRDIQEGHAWPPM